MKNEERIRKYGVKAYERYLQQKRECHKEHRAEDNARIEKWKEANPDKVKVHEHERNRKGGKYYEQQCKYQLTGLRHERGLIRKKHQNRYASYKQIIAAESQIHHEWVPGTADYTGVALVEADQHVHGYIDVIQLLEGEITLFTEKEITANLYPV